MEFGQRKRRRKSQSFKLVTDGGDYDSSYMMNSGCKEADSEPKDASVPDGDHQSDSWTSPGDPGPPPPPMSTSTSVANGPDCGHGARSRALRILYNTKDSIKVTDANDVVLPAAPEAPCCMCNCKGTLQAILQELRAMRRLMHTQKASLERQDQAAPPCQHRLGPGPTSRRRPRKRRPVFKVTPLPAAASSRGGAPTSADTSSHGAAAPESGRKEKPEKPEKQESSSGPDVHPPVSSDGSVLPAQNDAVTVNNTHNPLLNQAREPQALESEVRLAEDFDVFISKAQLDSILVNYTRSGSLLFRKLVCAFFDDTTLANSLPNGKRKRGLNDNRKGLDQNIVGAIKVFTEKYCTEHRIEKLPGPRDWVQILQDQIKLARRRLKRDAAEAEVSNGLSASVTPGCDYDKPGSVEQTVVNMSG